MSLRPAVLTGAALLFVSCSAHSAASPVVWADPTCEYVIMQLPGADPDEAFGLFASKTTPIPSVGDILEGTILGEVHLDVADKATGKRYSLYHWASGKSAESLVRHSPVHCASRYKKKS